MVRSGRHSRSFLSSSSLDDSYVSARGILEADSVYTVKNLKDRAALVTGASGAIGGAIARRLATAGAHVYLHYSSNLAAAESVQSDILSQDGKATLLQADLRQVDNIAKMFSELKSSVSTLDVLVNNAGVAVQKPIAAIEPDEYDSLMGVNTRAYFFVLKYGVGLMQKGGRVINISSAIAYSNRPGTSLYGSSRAAIQHLTRVAASEFGSKGITVNSVSPGPVSPGVFDQLPEPMQDTARRVSPFNRVGTPEEVAEVVGFLADDVSEWISGQDILVTGGGRP